MLTHEGTQPAAAAATLPPTAKLKSTLHKPPFVVDCPAFERTMRLQSLLATVVLGLGNDDMDFNDRCHLRDVVRFIYDEAETLGGEIEEMMLA